jgi:hypothetical protein
VGQAVTKQNILKVTKSKKPIDLVELFQLFSSWKKIEKNKKNI